MGRCVEPGHDQGADDVAIAGRDPGPAPLGQGYRTVLWNGRKTADRSGPAFRLQRNTAPRRTAGQGKRPGQRLVVLENPYPVAAGAHGMAVVPLEVAIIAEQGLDLPSGFFLQHQAIRRHAQAQVALGSGMPDIEGNRAARRRAAGEGNLDIAPAFAASDPGQGAGGQGNLIAGHFDFARTGPGHGIGKAGDSGQTRPRAFESGQQAIACPGSVDADPG